MVPTQLQSYGDTNVTLASSGASEAAHARAARWPLVLVMAVSLFIGFWRLGALNFFDPDDGLYVEVAREMLETGDWITPHFNGLRYLEKPPLFYWVTALALRLFGVTEFAGRLGMAVPAIGLVALTYALGRRLFGLRAGLYAGIALATSAGFFFYPRKVATDILFCFLLALALYGFILLYTEDDSSGSRGFWFLYGGMGLAVLTKGLIGLAFPVAIIGAYALVTRDRGFAPRLRLARGTLVVLGLAVPWHFLVAWRNPEFLWFYFVDNQLLRFLDRRGFVEDAVGLTAPAFLAVTLLWFFPWSLFLPAAVGPRALRGLAGPSRRGRLGWLVPIWAVAVLAFFSLSPGSLEYYGLPALPALALLVGAWWSGIVPESAPARRALGRCLAIGAVGAAGFVALVWWVRPLFSPENVFAALAQIIGYYRALLREGVTLPLASGEPYWRLAFAAGWIFFLGFALALAGHGRRAGGAFTAVAVAAGGLFLLVLGVETLLAPYHTVRPLAEVVNRQARAGDLVAVEGPLERHASLPLYTGRRIIVVNGRQGDLEFGSRFPEADGYFWEGEELGARWREPQRVLLLTDQPLGRSVLGRTGAAPVHVLARFGPRTLYSNRPAGGS